MACDLGVNTLTRLATQPTRTKIPWKNLCRILYKEIKKRSHKYLTWCIILYLHYLTLNFIVHLCFVLIVLCGQPLTTKPKATLIIIPVTNVRVNGCLLTRFVKGLFLTSSFGGDIALWEFDKYNSNYFLF